MTKVIIAFAAFTIVLVLATIVGYEVYEDIVGTITPVSTTFTPFAAAAEAHPSLLYGRITTTDGGIYEGRLRWGRDQEAFWGDYFNGNRDENPWVTHVPPERLRKESPLEIFGIEITKRTEEMSVRRPFMARFGDIARIEWLSDGGRVTLKSGTAFKLETYSASDFGDGVRVWDDKQGVLDIGSPRIRAVDLFSSPRAGAVPHRLHATVRTKQGDFTGFVQWNRNEGVGSDELDGRTSDDELHLRFDTIRSIARRSDDSSLVTLVDGREIVLSDTPDSGRDNLRIYVDDRRYGRVLISWDAFERLDFSPAGTSPAYDDFPPGRPLTGAVTTRDGRRLAGRLVYDLDESETTETVDAPSQGLTYTIPFGLIASIAFPEREERDQHVRVTLHSGEELRLEQGGDLHKENGGMLIFVNGGQRPEYLLGTDVQRIEFERPPLMYPRGSGQ
jgi:hypothetical protein